MSRIIALDIGEVRIGVAVSDPLGFFAQGVTVLFTKLNWLNDLEKIIKDYNATLILVGLPIRTDGKEGPEAQNIRNYANLLEKQFPYIDIEFMDERFTTYIAKDILLEADLSRSKRKQQIDKIAATILLQSYLDRKNIKNV